MNKYILPNEHVASIGMTGTGKSYLVENYLRGYKNVVKLDIKHEYDERMFYGENPWIGLKEFDDYQMCENLEELPNIMTEKIIYQPSYEYQTKEQYDLFFKWIFERGNTILWIDEMMNVGTANTYPPQLRRLYTMGRSHGIGIWACTQQPSNIPTVALANSKHFFVFNLPLPQDRKKLVDTTGQLELWEQPKGHNFWYYKLGEDKPRLAILVET